VTWEGIEATERLAESPNAKVIDIGSGRDGLPVILDTGGELTAVSASASVPPSIESSDVVSMVHVGHDPVHLGGGKRCPCHAQGSPNRMPTHRRAGWVRFKSACAGRPRHCGRNDSSLPP
jgi:hypothetical protein